MKKIGLILSVIIVALCASCSKSTEGEYTISSSLEIVAPSLPQSEIQALEQKYSKAISPFSAYLPDEDSAKSVFDEFCSMLLDGIKTFGTPKELKDGESITIVLELHKGDAKSGKVLRTASVVGTNAGWTLK